MRVAGGFLGRLGGLFGGRRLLGGESCFLGDVVSLTPLRVRRGSQARRDRVEICRITLGIASRKHLEARRWPASLRWTWRPWGAPPQWSEQSCQLGRVLLRLIHPSKAGGVQVAIQGPGPERIAIGRASGGPGQQRRSDSSGRLISCVVTSALEHVCGRPSGGVDAGAKPGGGGEEVFPALATRRDVLLRIARVGAGRQKLRDQRRVIDRQLVDRPDSHGRLAELAGGRSCTRISGSEFADQRSASRDELLERSVIQPGRVHGWSV